MKKARKGRFDRSKRGSILIAVLWSLFFLAALALVINITITPQLVLAARVRDRASMRYLAQAGARRAILEVRLDETQDYDALNEPWSLNEEVFKDVKIDEGEYFTVSYLPVDGDEGDAVERYGLTDEERKININLMPVDVLEKFFEIVGETSLQESRDIAEAIIDWRDEDDEPMDHGAESAYYEALEEGYPCKNGPFEILEELLLVRGVTPEIFGNVQSRLTIFGSGLVNINTADSLVLESLGMSREAARKIVSFRQGNDGQDGSEDDHIFESTEAILGALTGGISFSAEETDEVNAALQAGFLGVRSEHFRGEVVGGFEGRQDTVKVIFIVDRQGRIRYWQES